MLIVESISEANPIQIHTDAYVPITIETGDSCMTSLWRCFQGKGICELRFRDDDCGFHDFVLYSHPDYTLNELVNSSYGDAEIVEGSPVFRRLEYAEDNRTVRLYTSPASFVIEINKPEGIVQIRFGNQKVHRVIRTGHRVQWGIDASDQLVFLRVVECSESLFMNLCEA